MDPLNKRSSKESESGMVSKSIVLSNVNSKRNSEINTVLGGDNLKSSHEPSSLNLNHIHFHPSIDFSTNDTLNGTSNGVFYQQ